MVRPSYRANLAGDVGDQPFFAMIFDPAAEGLADPTDLRGGARAPTAVHRLADLLRLRRRLHRGRRPNKRIDTHISTPLFHLPIGAIPGPETEVLALPQRNLLRHITWSLPSGQAIARHLGAPVLAESDLAELSVFGLGLQASTPLWYYVLKEAELVEAGERLGPVGARVVGEVMLGTAAARSILLSRLSALAAEPADAGAGRSRANSGWWTC